MPSDNSRFAQAAATIGAGTRQAGQGLAKIDPEGIRRHAQEQQNALIQQSQEMEKQQMMLHQMQDALATKGINDVIKQGLKLSTPALRKAYFKDRQPQLNQYYQIKGRSLTPDAFELLINSSEDYTVAKNDLSMLYNRVLKNRLANKYEPINVTPEFLTQLQARLAEGPADLYAEDVKQLGEVQALAQEQAKAQFERETKLMEARQKKTAGPSETSLLYNSALPPQLRNSTELYLSSQPQTEAIMGKLESPDVQRALSGSLGRLKTKAFSSEFINEISGGAFKNTLPDELREYGALLERRFQQYRKEITGAQAAFQEIAYLRPLMGRFSDSPEYVKKLLEFTQAVEDIAMAKKYYQWRVSQGGRAPELGEMAVQQSQGVSEKMAQMFNAMEDAKKPLSVRELLRVYFNASAASAKGDASPFASMSDADLEKRRQELLKKK